MSSTDWRSWLARGQRWLRQQALRLPGGPARATRVVREGYDCSALAYQAWAEDGGENRRRERWAAALAAELAPGTRILDLGCGPGRELASWRDRGMQVTGLDLSAANLELARARCPGATLCQADMTEHEFPSSSFEVVTAFYSLIHVPRRHQAALLTRIHRWLRPGGLLVANLARNPIPVMLDREWMGGPMYWSSLGAARASHILRRTGFEIVHDETVAEVALGRRNTFFWLVARRSGPAIPGEAGLLAALGTDPSSGEADHA